MTGAVPHTAMVMAAGLGTRMRPLTATRPKPLIEVAGAPLIDHVLDHLRAAGVRRVVINVHYFADAIEAHLGQAAGDLDIAISDERALLMETGGGLVQARDLIGPDPFLCINSDNIWLDGAQESLGRLASHWNDGAMDALLLMVPTERATNHAGKGDFRLGADGQIVGRRLPDTVAPYVWAGIQILHPRLIANWPEEPFSTNLFWDRAIAAGRAFGVVHDGAWFDVGTPDAIGATEALLTRG